MAKKIHQNPLKDSLPSLAAKDAGSLFYKILESEMLSQEAVQGYQKHDYGRTPNFFGHKTANIFFFLRTIDTLI